MRLLFAITILAFCAVLWVALALARRVRLGQVLGAKSRPVRHLPSREFFEAGEFRTPRPMHLDQEIFQQKPRRALAEITFFPERPAQDTSRSAPDLPSTPKALPPKPASNPSVPAYATLFGQTVSISQIESHPAPVPAAKAARTPPVIINAPLPAAAVNPIVAPVDHDSRRIAPQSDRVSGLRRRIDLSHFNKDMGDLTDPYTNPLRGSGTQGPAHADSRYRYER